MKKKINAKIKFPHYKGLWIACHHGILLGAYVSKQEAIDEGCAILREKDISPFVRYYKLVSKKQQPKE